jgi:nucleotide-binding universal stress UspA family protein
MSRRIAPGFRHVLCPVDFSADSRAALRQAAAIASRSRGSLTVLYVTDPLLLAAAAAGYDIDEVNKTTRRELEQFARRAVPGRTMARLSPTCEVASGKPAREIVARATSGGYDLVVLGTRGLNGARKLFLGSTTAGVLRHTRVPVLVTPIKAARAAEVSGLTRDARRHAVAAIELGPHTAADMREYADAARRLRIALTLVHVVAVGPAPRWFRGDLPGQIRRKSSAAQKKLDALQAANAQVVRGVIVRAGHAPDEISAAAREARAAVVMMVLRARPGVVGTAAGAIAYHVLCNRVAPVLALPSARAARRQGGKR